MKQIWDKLTESINQYNTMIGELALEPINDVRIKKAVKKLIEAWAKLIAQRNELDRYMEPIEAISVKMPYETESFAEMWKTYKEYLVEDFSITMGSRRESITLNRLKKISNGNEQRAIDMLELFIANGYKSMFIPSEKQLKGEEPAKQEEQTTFDLNTKTGF